MPSLQFAQVLLTALLPLFSTIVAGAARQDKAPGWLNEFISFVTPLGAGVVNAAANGAQANSSGLVFLAVSTLLANLSHVPFLYGIQQQLQSKLLSFGVKPAQIQAFEQATIAHLPQMEALLMQLIDEVRGSRAQSVPTSNNPPGLSVVPSGSGAPVQINPGGSSAPVPQQPFPAQTLHWPGDTGVVPVAK